MPAPITSRFFAPSYNSSQAKNSTSTPRTDKPRARTARKTPKRQKTIASTVSKDVEEREPRSTAASFNIDLSQFAFSGSESRAVAQRTAASSSSRIHKSRHTKHSVDRTESHPTIVIDDDEDDVEQTTEYLHKSPFFAQSSKPRAKQPALNQTPCVSPHFQPSAELPLRPANAVEQSRAAPLTQTDKEAAIVSSEKEASRASSNNVTGRKLATIPLLPEIESLMSTQTDHFDYDPDESDDDTSRQQTSNSVDEGYVSFEGSNSPDATRQLPQAGSSTHSANPEFYAVRKGRMRGIFLSFEGEHGAKKHVESFPDADYRTFRTREEALEYLRIEAPKSRTSTRVLPALSQEAAATHLCDEQKKLVDLCLTGRNVFFTGKAGTGKSTVLRAIVRALEEQGKVVAKVAPTGMSALNIEGQTYHSWAGWNVDTKKKRVGEIEVEAESGSRCTRMNQTDTLIIDEISMIEANQFGRLDRVCRAARRHGALFSNDGNAKSEHSANLPFGGIQVIVCGDFRQLAPVRPFENCFKCGYSLVRKDESTTIQESKCPCGVDYHGKDSFAFSVDHDSYANTWDDLKFEIFRLGKVHRQADLAFIDILDTVRDDGQLADDQIRKLLTHASDTKNAMHLFPRNNQADRHNAEQLAQLPGRSRTFNCLDNFHWHQDMHPDLEFYHESDKTGPPGSLKQLKDNRLDRRLELKEGMPVMLIANIGRTLVNGSQGRLIGFQQYDPNKITETDPSSLNHVEMKHGEYEEYRRRQIRKWIADKPKEECFWPIVQFLDGTICVITAICRVESLGHGPEYSLISRTQIPLSAGWAITIHKSQGLSLDRIIVNLDDVVSREMIYVALSRARTLDGLKVVSGDGLATLRRKMLPPGSVAVSAFLRKIARKLRLC